MLLLLLLLMAAGCCFLTLRVDFLAEQQQAHILPVTIVHDALGLGQVKREPAVSPNTKQKQSSETAASVDLGVAVSAACCAQNSASAGAATWLAARYSRHMSLSLRGDHKYQDA
jgi:hypothetical protein